MLEPPNSPEDIYRTALTAICALGANCPCDDAWHFANEALDEARQRHGLPPVPRIDNQQGHPKNA